MKFRHQSIENMSKSMDNISKLKVLAVIACYGSKQIEYLKQVIATFKNMPMPVEVVVVSNDQKDLGKDVKVIAGLPSKDPYSLPFAHKKVFADNVDSYDLFVYTEDDVLVTEGSIRAYLNALRILPEDEIPGHLRYELDRSGKMWFPDIFGQFYWKPDSVKMRGDHMYAEFTNEHTGYYVLTQKQLKRVIKSGGFLREPYYGRYGMLETAATDPFTSCGFRKVICISQLDDFLVHHMSNRYAGKSGVPRETLVQQIQILKNIHNGKHPAVSLCQLETKMPKVWWSKDFYERPLKELVELMPEHPKNVLSVGCGWGETEALLKRKGAKVTALPVDSVVGAVAAQHGIDMIYGTLDEGLKQVKGKKFDCILMQDMLHLLPEQEKVLKICFEALEKGGTMLLSGPNFTRIPFFVKRAAGLGDYRKLKNFSQSGINVCGPSTVAKHARKAGARVTATRWVNHALPGRRLAKKEMSLGRLTAKNWVVQVKR